MESPPGEKRGLGAAARIVSERAGSIIRLELQLAAAELKKKVASLGVGIALFGVAAFLAIFALGVYKLRKGTPLVPEQAIEEAKLVSEALRNGSH